MLPRRQLGARQIRPRERCASLPAPRLKLAGVPGHLVRDAYMAVVAPPFAFVPLVPLMVAAVGRALRGKPSKRRRQIIPGGGPQPVLAATHFASSVPIGTNFATPNYWPRFWTLRMPRAFASRSTQPKRVIKALPAVIELRSELVVPEQREHRVALVALSLAHDDQQLSLALGAGERRLSIQ
jgi:hypothetical protein